MSDAEQDSIKLSTNARSSTLEAHLLATTDTRAISRAANDGIVAVGADVVLVIMFRQADGLDAREVFAIRTLRPPVCPAFIEKFSTRTFEVAIRRMSWIGVVDAWEADLSLWRRATQGMEESNCSHGSAKCGGCAV